MEAINFIKKYHKRYLIETNNNIVDEYNLNYNDYLIIYSYNKEFDIIELIQRCKLFNYSNNKFIKYIKLLYTITSSDSNPSSIHLLHNYNLLFIKLNNELLIHKLLDNNKQLVFNMYVDNYFYNEKISTKKNKTINKLIKKINNFYNVDCKSKIKILIKDYLFNLKLKNMNLLKLNDYDSNYNIIDFIAYNPNKDINNKLKDIINNNNIFFMSLTYSHFSTYEISMYNLISIIKILKNKLDYLKLRFHQNINRYNQIINHININNITSTYEINELLNYYVKIHYTIIFNGTYYIYLNYQPFYILYYINILNYPLDVQYYIMEIVWKMCILIIKRLIIKLSILTQTDNLNEINKKINYNELMKNITYKENMKFNINMIIENLIKYYKIKEFSNCIINDNIIIKEKQNNTYIKTEDLIDDIDNLNISYNLTSLYSYLVNILKYNLDYNEFINYMLIRKQKLLVINEIKKLPNENFINIENIEEEINKNINKKIKYFNLNLVEIRNKINNNKELDKYELVYYYSQNLIHQQIYYFLKENILIYQIKDDEILNKIHNKYYDNEYVKNQNMNMIHKLIKRTLLLMNEDKNKEFNFINDSNLEKMIKENIKKNIKKEINILIY